MNGNACPRKILIPLRHHERIELFLPYLEELAWPGSIIVFLAASTYRQTVITRIEVNTNTPAKVWVSDRSIGTTPITSPFNYEEEVDRQVKNANY